MLWLRITYRWTSIGGEVQNCTGVVSLRPQTQDSSSLLHELEAVVLPPALWTYNLMLDDLWEEVALFGASTSKSSVSALVSSSLMTSDHFRFSAVADAALFLLFLFVCLRFSNGVLDDCFFFRLRWWALAPSLIFCSLIISFSSSSEE